MRIGNTGKGIWVAEGRGVEKRTREETRKVAGGRVVEEIEIGEKINEEENKVEGGRAV